MLSSLVPDDLNEDPDFEDQDDDVTWNKFKVVYIAKIFLYTSCGKLGMSSLLLLQLLYTLCYNLQILFNCYILFFRMQAQETCCGCLPICEGSEETARWGFAKVGIETEEEPNTIKNVTLWKQSLSMLFADLDFASVTEQQLEGKLLELATPDFSGKIVFSQGATETHVATIARLSHTP